MNATEIRSKVTEILSAAGVTYTARRVGETRRKDWQCDARRVAFKPAAGPAFETDYFTGLGHRKPAKGAPADKGRPGTLYREQWEKRYLEPQAPDAADVLYSLVLDAQADSESFPDWCADFGYSDDSIDAFETYRACCDIGRQLRTVFRPEVLAQIRDAVAEL